MKKLYFLLLTLLITSFSYGQTVFINEIHYDNAGTDSGEGVEIAGPAGTDLSTYTLTAYNGNGGASYTVVALTGTIPNQGATGYGTVFFAISGLQNGSPDGIALDNGGALIQFLSYEGAFTAVNGVANGVTSTDIGVSEDGSVDGQSLQLVGSGNVYTDFTWNTQSASSYDLINPGQTFGAASPSINISAPTDASVLLPGTTSVDVVFSTNNLIGGESVNITVNGSTTNDVTSPFNIVTTDGMTYNVTVDLVNGGVLDSDSVSFSVASYTQVANLAALRADVDLNGEGGYYEVMSVPNVTYTRTSRNQKYIQDTSAGILIDDTAGTITTTFAIGDGMSGLKGQTTSFGSVLQLVPTANATVTGNDLVTPEVVSIATLSTNWEDYESELVRINGVTFADAGGTFAASTIYPISDPATMDFRTSFSEADYIGATIPTGVIDIIVLVAEFNGSPQVTARTLTDLTLSVDQFSTTDFSVYPNPSSNGLVHIKSNTGDAMSVTIFDVLGKQVMNQTVSNNRLNVASLKSGIYIMKISQDNATVTKKLVIK